VRLLGVQFVLIMPLNWWKSVLGRRSSISRSDGTPRKARHRGVRIDPAAGPQLADLAPPPPANSPNFDVPHDSAALPPPPW
jgi:hypothetical protein